MPRPRTLACAALALAAPLAGPRANAQCVEQWLPAPAALPGPVVAATVDDPDGPGGAPGRILMIAGGQLHQWDGAALTRLSPEIIGTGFGNGIAVYHGEIYVAGFFSAIGAVSARGVARFDGAAWHDVNSNATNGINFITGGFTPDYNLAVYNDELYFGGGFSTAGGAPADRIVRWNGSQWNSLGGVGLTGWGVLSLRVINNELYVGGEQTSIAGIPGTFALARWNGAQWLPANLPFGPFTYVASIGDLAGVPYIFGALYDPSGRVLVGGLARKTPSSWEIAPGGGVHGGPVPWIAAFREYRGKLAVAGLFLNAGPLGGVNDIAFYSANGSWSRLLGGLGLTNFNHAVSEVLVYRDELHALGNFTQADGRPQNYWARWYEGPPIFSDHPDTTYLTACDASKTFSVAALGASSYRWRRNGADLADGPTGNGGSYAGTASPTLTITNPSQLDAGAFDCVATNPCGARDSDDALLIACAVDFNCDGFVDFFDYDDYVLCFETGACLPITGADFNGDGFVDFFDYDAFVLAFEQGC